jgi:hypothetical protein
MSVAWAMIPHHTRCQSACPLAATPRRGPWALRSVLQGLCLTGLLSRAFATVRSTKVTIAWTDIIVGAHCYNNANRNNYWSTILQQWIWIPLLHFLLTSMLVMWREVDPCLHRVTSNPINESFTLCFTTVSNYMSGVVFPVSTVIAVDVSDTVIRVLCFVLISF